MTDFQTDSTRTSAFSLVMFRNDPESSVPPTVFVLAVGKCEPFFQSLAFQLQARYFGYSTDEPLPAYHTFVDPYAFETFLNSFRKNFPYEAADLETYRGVTELCARFTVIDASELYDEIDHLQQ